MSPSLELPTSRLHLQEKIKPSNVGFLMRPSECDPSCFSCPSGSRTFGMMTFVMKKIENIVVYVCLYFYLFMNYPLALVY